MTPSEFHKDWSSERGTELNIAYSQLKVSEETNFVAHPRNSDPYCAIFYILLYNHTP